MPRPCGFSIFAAINSRMILPIVAYGDPILRETCAEIDHKFPDLNTLIDNMFETMYSAKGVGLAAPQIGQGIRLFIVDASPFAEGEDGDPDCQDFKRVFINPIIFDETGEEWPFEEGCLSIPNIREEVERKSTLKIEYYDQNWDLYEEELDGFPARIVQHEYDHIEGILFTDKISKIRRAMLKSRLADISKGDVEVAYKMRFPKLKRK
jgi:peptide deformylase